MLALAVSVGNHLASVNEFLINSSKKVISNFAHQIPNYWENNCYLRPFLPLYFNNKKKQKKPIKK